ncbi:hypothetical protein HanIR_Chr05g0224861 [Helianthus annuus]|nr:hypothetical protein HanIR_Chr05g0224861 [Helianthus annuus]
MIVQHVICLGSDRPWLCYSNGDSVNSVLSGTRSGNRSANVSGIAVVTVIDLEVSWVDDRTL